MVNRSLLESTQSSKHTECSVGFLSQETRTYTFSWSHAKFQQFFSYQFLFLLGQSSKHLKFRWLHQVWRQTLLSSRTSTWLLQSDLFRTVILADLELHDKLTQKQTRFLMQPYAPLARIKSQNFTSPFLPATISLASLHKTHVCVWL